MRLFLAFLTTLGILGCLQLFIASKHTSAHGGGGAQRIQATGEFQVEIRLSFDAGPDPFSLDAINAPSLVVQREGNELLRRTDVVSGGEPIVVRGVTGIVDGRNEFFVSATPRDDGSMHPHAIRLTILRDGNPIANTTLWAESGSTVQGPVVVDLANRSNSSTSPPKKE